SGFRLVGRASAWVAPRQIASAPTAVSDRSLVAAENLKVIASSWAGGSPYPVWGYFSRRGHAVTRSIAPHRLTIMQPNAQKLRQNQHLARWVDQRRPRRRGFCR